MSPNHTGDRASKVNRDGVSDEATYALEMDWPSWFHKCIVLWKPLQNGSFSQR